MKRGHTISKSMRVAPDFSCRFELFRCRGIMKISETRLWARLFTRAANLRLFEPPLSFHAALAETQRQNLSFSECRLYGRQGAVEMSRRSDRIAEFGKRRKMQ